MGFHLKKLNSKGFGHHLIIPVIAIAVIAGIGTYVLTRSKAATVTTTTNGLITVSERSSDGYGRIYKVDPSSGAKTLLQQLPVGYQVDRLAWSKQGTRYSYTTGYDLFVSGAADTTGKLIASASRTNVCGSMPESYDSPTFSPDGTQLAIVRQVKLSTNCDQSVTKITKMSVDGTNPVDVDISGMTWYSAMSLQWASNGNFYFDNADGIYSVPSTGGTPTKIRDTYSGYSYQTGRYVYSYDGSKVATERYLDGKTEIYVSNVDGSNPQAITQVVYDGSSANNFGLVWAPDGKSLGFIGRTDTTMPRGIYTATVTTDGSPSIVKRLTDAPAEAQGTGPVISWQPIVTTTTTTTTTTLLASGNWILANGAVRTTDQKRTVIKLNASSTAKASTVDMSKLSDFVKANYGKQARLCIVARNTAPAPLQLAFNSFITGTDTTRQFSFPTSYSKQCTSFTVTSKAAYSSALQSGAKPGFTLRVPPATSSTPSYFIDRVELVAQ